MENKYLISIPFAAKAYGLNRTKLYELANSDPTLPLIQIGSVKKLNRVLFEKWLDDACKERKQL